MENSVFTIFWYEYTRTTGKSTRSKEGNIKMEENIKSNNIFQGFTVYVSHSSIYINIITKLS